MVEAGRTTLNPPVNMQGGVGFGTSEVQCNGDLERIKIDFGKTFSAESLLIFFLLEEIGLHSKVE